MGGGGKTDSRTDSGRVGDYLFMFFLPRWNERCSQDGTSPIV